MNSRPMMMTAYEMPETTLNQPTTFQFKRRKNMLRSVRLVVGDQIVFDDHVHKKARDENGGDQRERGAPEQRVGEAFDGARSQEVQHARADDRREMAIEHG